MYIQICTKKEKGSEPLALIRCFLSLLQFLQGCGQPFLGSIQLLFHELDTSVQSRYLPFSL